MTDVVPTKGDAALALKIAGATWTQIKDTLGYPSEKAAQNAVMRAAAVNVSDQDRSSHRQMADMRYSRLLRAVWSMATSPDDAQFLPAQRAARELIDRLVALHGAAAPQEFIVTTPSEAELRAWVAKVAGIEAPPVVEYDIFDAEVVPELPASPEMRDDQAI